MIRRIFPPWGMLLASLALAGATACAPYVAPVIPPLGFIYCKVSAPLITPSPDLEIGDFEDVEIHTSHFQIPYSYLRIINLAWGDTAVEQAVAESGFDEVYFADCTFFTILHIYSTLTVRVHGVRGEG